MEAAASGTPVLASAIDGNIGMLGADYAGYFPCDDVEALVALLLRCRETAAAAAGEDAPRENLLQRLAAQCHERAPLFSPARERAELRRLVADLLGAN
jgi:glycosyltransferase involved in cell wall biosynthesis